MFILLIAITALLAPNQIRLSVDQAQIKDVMQEKQRQVVIEFETKKQLVLEKNRQDEALLTSDFEDEKKSINAIFIAKINAEYEKLANSSQPQNRAIWGGIVIDTSTQDNLNQINAIKERIESIKRDQKLANESVANQYLKDMNLLKESLESKLLVLSQKQMVESKKITANIVQQMEIQKQWDPRVVSIVNIVNESFKSNISYTNFITSLCVLMILMIMSLQYSVMGYLNRLYKAIIQAKTR